MSSTSTDYGAEQNAPQRQQLPFGPDYVLTEEERRVLKECNSESFWYRSLPLSLLSMATTQFLVSKGTLTAHRRFGSLPKVFFAGFLGFTAGRISYQKTYMERLSRLENSPLGEFLRQKSQRQSPYSTASQSEMSDSSMQSFDSSFQTSEASTLSSDYGYNPDATPDLSRMNDLNTQAPAQSYMDEEKPSKKTILYEDLRLKNRENYEVTLTQRSEALLKPAPESAPKRPTKEVKKNIYGDTWEE
ncbi:OCIA domain-containing protein 1-like isoform X1 [Synchiropus splendidus]|uniref:OCIA domain-containing protein 1-like isoform X1 n=1 Tax=Synchiropus splendidus TaxID=270530 RepID=UPI00237DE68F|nr:OCIA domain-containing protein 1-like isoform X1 [Synchiropus splendidus]